MSAGKSTKPLVTAFIGLGSNIEPRSKYIERAVNLMNAHPQIKVTKVSSLYQTDPVGGPRGQGRYLNGAAEIRTSLAPHELLDALQAIEAELGRKRETFWGPRTIDLDILLYGDQIISTDRLLVPHPRMHERRFVLQGLAEIAPEVIHPMLEMTAQTILEAMGDEE